MIIQNPLLQKIEKIKKKSRGLYYALVSLYILVVSTASAVALFTCIAIIGQSGDSSSEKSYNYVPPKNENEKLDDISAYIEAQEYVKQALKSPSTAKFPATDFLAHSFGDNEYEVISYVDSQNSFGAMIRSNWNVQFQMLNNNQQKKLTQLSINGNVVYPVEKSKAYQGQQKIKQQAAELQKEIEGMQNQLESLK